MKKRFLSAILALSMLVSLVPAMGTTAKASDDSSRPAVNCYTAHTDYASPIEEGTAYLTYMEIESDGSTHDDNISAKVIFKPSEMVKLRYLMVSSTSFGVTNMP